MAFLSQLWLPIILSAVFVFIVSSIIHMALPIHKSDCKKIRNEGAVIEALRSNGVEPGEYMFPRADSMKDMCSPEMMEKVKRGPSGWLIVAPAGGFNIGKSLIHWFIYCLIVGVLSAYVGWYSLGVGAKYLTVFRITGTAAILGYAVGNIPNSIWKGASWSTTMKFIFDGVVYALVTAGTFGWLWPHAAGTP
jgi:hypothetical protein